MLQLFFTTLIKVAEYTSNYLIAKQNNNKIKF